MKIKEINPFTDVKQDILENPFIDKDNYLYLYHIRELKINRGDIMTKIDREGLYMGKDKITEAKTSKFAIDKEGYTYAQRMYLSSNDKYFHRTGNDIYWYNGTTSTKLN